MSQRTTPRFRCRPLRADGLALRVGSLRHEDPGSGHQGAAGDGPGEIAAALTQGCRATTVIIGWWFGTMD